VNPVWFEFDGEQLVISQTKTRQKYRNVQKDPRVAVSIIDPENPYRYVEVRGEVVDIADDEGNAFINKMAKKYIGQDVYPWHQPGDERVVVRIQPKRATSMG
jgi:PPOX class probable F420-dependent enzyme